MTSQEEILLLREENLALRRMLWLAKNDGSAYGDDGEMQLWCIDFRRASATEIEDALIRIGRRQAERLSECAPLRKTLEEE
jgi:hypothetical protein